MGRINEGPFMLKKDGLYYLTYSGSHFESPNYGCGYAVSDDPLKGFEKYEYNPIMQSNSLVKGAGHHCITTSPDGTEMFMVYHCHNNTTTTEPRRLCIDRIQFTEENGVTVLEVKGPTVTPQSIPSGASDVDNVISIGNQNVGTISVEAGSTPDTWNLPEEIKSIVTSKSQPDQPYTARVLWDTSDYDPSDRTERKVTVKGTVVLPEGVVNLGDLDLNVTMTVSVSKDVDNTDYHGLYAQYYTTVGSGTSVRLNNLKSEGIDYDIQFSDLDAKLALTTGQSDAAGIRWTGRIQVPETGNYTFYAYSDNGFRLWVNDEQLINYWDGGSWDVLQTSKKVYLEEGTYYTFKAEYFDYEGGSHAILSWSNDVGIERKAIPASAFYLPENYQGIYLSDLDSSEGNLTQGEDFDGTLIVTGQNLTSAEYFEVVKATGESLEEPAIAKVESVSGKSAKIVIPAVSVGTYKLKAAEGNVAILSEQNLIIKPDTTAEPDRSETPRRDWMRDSYVNLNGWWKFAFDANEEGIENGWYSPDQEFEMNINVPFCWESSLSGIKDENYKGQAWYQRKVTVDESWEGQKMFLKFGAVDWKCKLWVNGEEVGEHIGGYNAFEFDVTDYLKAGEENTITLWVEDKGSYGDDSYPALIGKQGRNAPCGYIHTSGIWQTVGLEARSAVYLDNAKAATDVDASTVNYTLDITSGAAQELTVEYEFESKIYDIDKDEDIPTGSSIKGSQTIQVEAGASAVDLEAIQVENAKLWNYDDPNLYYGTLTIKDSQGAVLDEVGTYFGMRKVETKYFDESLGTKYIYINNKPVYMSGLLDQGFWEGGIYTAPSEEALKYDILAMKEDGFNMIRKHLKVEDPLQYYWCDKLGMMVWQDMPHATAMVPSREGAEAPGRQYYEECLEAMMNMNYNHPSIVAVMLFNETWGLQDAYFNGKRDVKAADGKSTKDWVEELFNKTKELNPNVLVEDMSACNADHVQPTELNTYHMYPNSYAGTLSDVERWVNGTYVGSTVNFKFGEVQDGDPMLNSEYGGVAAYAGDFDVSYCFKYMTDIQRRYEKQSGFVYTEPYDVEYERNGILTYDRKKKVFGYDEIAYGGDMTIKDLTQEIYVGLVDQPIRNVKPGQKMKTKALAIAWTEDLPDQVVMKWRFDGTDIYGNSISTGITGEKALNLSPYRKTTATLNYLAPTQACVGTLTIWLEDGEGNKIAKNFTNVVVADDTSSNKAYTQENEDGSVVMKAEVEDSKMVTTEGTGAQTYSYTLPEDFDLENLTGMRVLAEASSYKGQIGTDKNLSSYSSQYGQTAEGRERASDLTVSVNGVEVDTVYLPDNPRDMRGTLTLNSPYNGQTSAGDFGYLVNLNISEEKLEAIKAAMGEDKEIQVTYEVKEDAENQNGLRIYSSTYGRYAVNPTLVLNPSDEVVSGVLEQDQEIAVDENNYSVEAALESQESYVVRNDEKGGYQVAISEDGAQVVVTNKATGEILASAELEEQKQEYQVKTTLFDERISVYVDNNPEPAIQIYDKSGFTGGVTAGKGTANVVIAPESYQAVQTSIDDTQKDVNVTDDFSDTDLDSRYEKMGNNLNAQVQDGALKLSAVSGDKLIMNNVWMADGIYEADITINSLSDANGNTGFTFRSTNYQLGSDGLDGYYAGIGNGFVQVGRMNNNWTELANVKVPELRTGTTHKLKVAVFGSRIQVYLDDVKTPYVDIVDSTYTEGSASIRGFRSTATVDNVRVVSVPCYTSDFAHGTGEWDADGLWKNEDGAYTASSSKALAIIDSTEQKDLAVAVTMKAADDESLPSILVRGQSTAEGLEGYRVVLSAKEDKLQLVKSVKGADTVLAERSWKLDTDTFYRVTIEAKGASLKVYLDDAKQAMLAVEDQTFEKGLVGLYSVSGTSTYAELSVTGEYIDGELLPEADTASLDQLLAQAENLNPEDYTQKSYAKVADAVKAAGEINRYDQAEVDQMVEVLKEAMDNLIKTGPLTMEDLEEAVRRAQAAEAAAKEAKELAQAAQEEADRLKAEAVAAKEAAEAAQKKAQEMANAAEDERIAAEKAAQDAADLAKAAQEKADAAEAAVTAAKAAQTAAEEAAAKAQDEAEAIRAELKATQDELAKAKEELEKAKEEAVKAREAAEAAAKRAKEAAEALKKELAGSTSGEQAAVKKGDIVSDGKLNYKVTSTEAKTLSVVGKVKKSGTSVTIPATVKVQGTAYKVTAIAKAAFKNNKKLTKVTIGKNVKTIGAKAFYKNSKLKNVVVKTKQLNTVGKNAFKGIAKRAYLNVPNKKVTAYKKVFKKAGLAKTVKMK